MKRLTFKELLPLLIFLGGVAITMLGTGITMRQDIALLRADLADFHREFGGAVSAITRLEMRIDSASERLNALDRQISVLEERNRYYHGETADPPPRRK